MVRQYRVVKVTINLPMDFPADWTDEEIEFYLNESSSCCDNRIDDLRRYSESHGCICSITNHEVYPDKFDDPDSANNYAVRRSVVI